ncbi:MAG: dihydrodipicolinate reductase [Thermoprotei archaeon]|nr:dihydrodipicolinate reductase [Thermoprotei archaeon]
MRLGFFGFGAIGRLTARVALDRGYEIAGVVDIDPRIAGLDAGEVLGLGEKLGVTVSPNVEVLKDSDVVVHATGSFLDKVYDQLISIVNLGVDVVSTCETLAYPWYRYPVLARRLDEAARRYNAAVIGTGINPGFLLDTLIVTLTAPFNIVKGVKAVRSLNAATRREPFRRKIGVGEDPKTVAYKLEKGEITGHVGYAESVLLVADAAGIQLARVHEAQEPVAAEEDVEYGGIRVPKGYNKGIRGYGAGYLGEREVIRIEFQAYVGAEDYEEITIEGRDYTVKWRSTGTPGDMGTASVVLGVAETLGGYGPGLLTMIDLLPFRPPIKH